MVYEKKRKHKIIAAAYTLRGEAVIICALRFVIFFLLFFITSFNILRRPTKFPRRTQEKKKNQKLFGRNTTVMARALNP